MSRAIERASTILQVAALAISVLAPSGPCTLGADLRGSAGVERPGIPAATRPDGCFIENRGQWPAAVRFAAQADGVLAALEDGAIALNLRPTEAGGGAAGATVRLRLLGASGEASPLGVGERRETYGFLVGDDPARWRRGAAVFDRVSYADIFPGIDLEVRFQEEGRLEYDLLLKRGADLERISIECEGVDDLRSEAGDLVLCTSLGSLRHPRPRTWRVLPGGGRSEVECGYRILGPTCFGFEASRVDPTLPLVVDPQVVWSTYLGGTAGEQARAVVFDESGVTILGYTSSWDFPAPDGSPISVRSGPSDAYVAKLSPDGREVVSVLLLGGQGDDKAYGAHLDPDGRLVVAGVTSSGDFPTTPGAFQTVPAGGEDAFVIWIDSGWWEPDAAAEPQDLMVYSTVLGGSGDDGATGLDVDDAGNAAVTGHTGSVDFPTTPGSCDEEFAGGVFDAFFAEVSPGSAGAEDLVYCSFIGGSGNEPFGDLAVNSALHRITQHILLYGDGSVVLSGTTTSWDFPTTPDAYDPRPAGNYDVYVLRLLPDAQLAPSEQLVYSTIIGGWSAEAPYSVVAGWDGSVVVSGYTWSPDFPTTPGAFDRVLNAAGSSEENDGFLTELIPDASKAPPAEQLVYSTFFGGAGHEGYTRACPAEGHAVYLAGTTSSNDFPITDDASDPIRGGTDDAFLCRLALDEGVLPESAVTYGTFLGGSANEAGNLLATDGRGGVLVSGRTWSVDFPATTGAWDATHNGGEDVFVTRYEARVPRACIEVSPDPPSGVVPLRVAVDGSCSTTPAGTAITSYDWDLGDGATAEGATADHTYDAPGRYVVKLTVRNSVGVADRKTWIVTAECPPGDVAPWTAADVGAPLYPGSARTEGEDVLICAGGRGIAAAEDELHFVYREVEGDFQISARLSDLQGGNTSAGAGLLVRAGLGGKDPFVGLFAERQAALGTSLISRCRSRSEAGVSPNAKTLPDVPRDGLEEAPLWLRIRRTGGQVSVFASRSPEGVFSEVPDCCEPPLRLEGPVLVGLAAFGKDLGPETQPFRALQARFEEVDLPWVPPSPGFVRGDANADSAVDISDVMWILGYLFLGGGEPSCLDALDVDDSADDAPAGGVDISDAIYLLNHLFLGGPEPPPPYPDCGPDPTADALGCESFPPCE